MPPTLTLEKLRGPHASVPHNPLLAEPMYLTKYIERMGTGIRDMIRRCRTAGLAEPEIRLDGGFFVLTIRRKTSETGTRSDQVGTRLPSKSPDKSPAVDPGYTSLDRLARTLAAGKSRKQSG